MNRKILLTLAGLSLTSLAHALNFDLFAASASTVGGNTTSTFYEVSGAGAESGTAAAFYSSSLGGNANDGFWVKFSFGGNPQPVLQSAFLKASNKYLWWDSTDLAAFNAGTFDSLTLWNSGAAGLKNKNNKFHGTSHAGLNGSLGETDIPRVPESGTTAALLGLALVGLHFGFRRRS